VGGEQTHRHLHFYHVLVYRKAWRAKGNDEFLVPGATNLSPAFNAVGAVAVDKPCLFKGKDARGCVGGYGKPFGNFGNVQFLILE
jgi:hypothetical protein